MKFGIKIMFFATHLMFINIFKTLKIEFSHCLIRFYCNVSKTDLCKFDVLAKISEIQLAIHQFLLIAKI